MTSRRTLFFLALSGLAGCRRSRAPRLNVFNWSNYVAPQTIPRFTRETGIEVRYAIYESNEEMLARVLSANSGWDVVFPSNYFIAPMRDLGLLAPLDHSLLPNAPTLSPPWDPARLYSLPYIDGASGILSNPKLIQPPTAYAGLWNPNLQGRLTMLDDPPEVFGAAQLKLHRPLNDENLDPAYQEALRQKPLVRAYINSEVRDQLVAGDLAVSQMWATTAQQAIDAAPHLVFHYPREGYARYTDCAAILAESRRPRQAHAFLNYLHRPEVAAEITIATRTATTNPEAKRQLPPQIAHLETLFPPKEAQSRAQYFQPLSPKTQRHRDRLWTHLKNW